MNNLRTFSGYSDLFGLFSLSGSSRQIFSVGNWKKVLFTLNISSLLHTGLITVRVFQSSGKKLLNEKCCLYLQKVAWWVIITICIRICVSGTVYLFFRRLFWVLLAGRLAFIIVLHQCWPLARPLLIPCITVRAFKQFKQNQHGKSSSTDWQNAANCIHTIRASRYKECHQVWNAFRMQKIHFTWLGWTRVANNSSARISPHKCCNRWLCNVVFCFVFLQLNVPERVVKMSLIGRHNRQIQNSHL